MFARPDRPFRIVVFNVENLFVRFDREPPEPIEALSEAEWKGLTISTTPNKPLRSTLGVARALIEADPDVAILCEVGGLESIENFSRRFLGGRWRPHLIEGNSDRGIDVGYLVKEGIGLEAELVSHRDRPIGFLYPHERQSRESGYVEIPSGKIESHRFSRDALELRLRPKGRPEGQPTLVLLAAHLKSQLDPDNVDPFGRDRRKAELETLVEIWREARERFGEGVPVMIGGDFNGQAGGPDPDPEFAALHARTTLVDALESVGRALEERETFVQVQPGGSSKGRRLDFLFVPREIAGLLDRDGTYVHRYRNARGDEIPKPRTMEEKRLLPSDHYPVVATFRAALDAALADAHETRVTHS